MIHRDPFTRADFHRLNARRGVCISVYLPTSRVTQDTNKDRIVLKNLIEEASVQAGSISDKREVTAAAERMLDLLHDEEFWAHQANGLAVLSSGERLETYRLASIERTMRPVLKRESQSLLLATTVELQAMYSEANTYPHLADISCHGSVENLPLPILAEQLEPLVANLRDRRLKAWEAH